MISLEIARPKHRLLLLGMFRVGIRRLIERTGRITSESAVEQNFHLIRNIFFQRLFGRYLELVCVLVFFYFRHGQGTAKYLPRRSFAAFRRRERLALCCSLTNGTRDVRTSAVRLSFNSRFLHRNVIFFGRVQIRNTSDFNLAIDNIEGRVRV